MPGYKAISNRLGSLDAFRLGYYSGIALAPEFTRAAIEAAIAADPHDADVKRGVGAAQAPLERVNEASIGPRGFAELAAANGIPVSPFEATEEWKSIARAHVDAAIGSKQMRPAFELGCIAGDTSLLIFMLRSLSSLRVASPDSKSLRDQVGGLVSAIDRATEHLLESDFPATEMALETLLGRPDFQGRIGARHDKWIADAFKALGQLAQNFENELPIATAPPGERERELREQILREPARDDLREQYAVVARLRNDPRATLIDLQLTARDLRRRGIPPGYGDRRREASRLIEANPQWTDAVVAMGVGAVMHRGFVEEIHCDVSTFLSRIEALMAIEPILHVVFTGAAGRVAEIAACPSVTNLQSMSFARNGISDADITALASSPFVGNLRWLDLGWNKITDAGVDALAAGRAKALVCVDLGSNPCTNPIDEQLYFDDTRFDWLPSKRGRALEAAYGPLAWLHPTSDPWPPPMGIV